MGTINAISTTFPENFGVDNETISTKTQRQFEEYIEGVILLLNIDNSN